MARVRPKGSAPEMAVRRGLHRLGYRYRLHCAGLPGRPDLVFASRRKVVFVNGCFWHGHPGCRRARMTASNREFWRTKLERNRSRDLRNVAALRESGWEVLTVWECGLRDLEAVLSRISRFLGPPGSSRHTESNVTRQLAPASQSADGPPRFSSLRCRRRRG